MMHCCARMALEVEKTDPAAGRSVIRHRDGIYEIIAHDEMPYVKIAHCPFCGRRLSIQAMVDIL